MKTKIVEYRGFKYAVAEETGHSGMYQVVAKVLQDSSAEIVRGIEYIAKDECVTVEDSARIMVVVGYEGLAR